MSRDELYFSGQFLSCLVSAVYARLAPRLKAIRRPWPAVLAFVRDWDGRMALALTCSRCTTPASPG